MKEKMSSCHAVFWLKFHLILVTKYRRPYLSKEVMNETIIAIKQKLLTHNIMIDEVNGEEDHIHILLSSTPSSRLDQAIGQAKGYSSFMIRKLYPTLKREKSFWSDSYGLFSVGANESIIAKYIENQGKK